MKKVILVLLTMFYVTVSFSQNTMVTRKWRNKENDSLVKAQTIFEARNYLVALGYFEKILDNHPNELYLKYVVGICGLYRSDSHEKSLEYLSETYIKNRRTNDIEYDLARAQHYNYRFDDALTNIDDFLKKKNLTEIQKKEAALLQDFCNNGKELVARPVNAKIESIGKDVNTTNSEYSPSVSSDENTMIFTYKGEESMGGKQNELNQPDPLGEFNEDVFISRKENGVWTKPVSMGPLINTNLNDAAISISNDGQKLFVYRDDASDGGDIYMSTLSGDNWSAPEKLKGEVNTYYWEGSASLSADGKTLFFASERPGGVGGRDLYKATLQDDGTWKEVQNLGIEVNTKFDDDAPFIHPDGKTLTYSTQGLKSMGYNDIFVTRFNEKDTSWTHPENIGYPINSTDDDGFFVLSTSGERGFFSSGRKGGFGQQDIYSVNMPSTFLRPIVETVKGKVTINDKPGEATVTVDIVNKNKNYGNFISNSSTGNYLVNIPSGNNYKITYKAEGFPPQVQMVDATNLTAYLEKIINIQFPFKKDLAVAPDGGGAATKTPVDGGATTDVGTKAVDGSATPGANNAGGTSGGATPGATNAGGAMPAATILTGTTPGSTTAGGANPGATTAGGTTPDATNAGGAIPAATNLTGTTLGGTTAGGTTPGTTTAGGTAGASSTASGTNPSATTAGGTTPGTATAGGTTPGATTAGGAIPAATNLTGTAPGATTAGGTNPGATTAGGATTSAAKAEAEAKAAEARMAKVNATEAKVASKVGNESKPGLTFRIQVAALSSPKSFDYSKLKGLGKSEKLKLDDGLTRITVGKFTTLNQALEFKKKVREAGISDAFITAIYKGKRVYLTELVTMGLLQVDDK